MTNTLPEVLSVDNMMHYQPDYMMTLTAITIHIDPYQKTRCHRQTVWCSALCRNFLCIKWRYKMPNYHIT